MRVASRAVSRVAVSCALVVMLSAASAQDALLESRLTAHDPPFGPITNAFGQAVEVSGETLIVGAWFAAPGDKTGAGAAYAFVREGTGWTQQAQLVASDSQGFDMLGASVAVDGGLAAAGAPGDDHSAGADAGSVYVFRRTGTSWAQEVRLRASDGAANDHFGVSVAIVGETVFVGAPDDGHAGGSGAGSVYVFEHDGSGWHQTARLTASDAGADDGFGQTLAARADTLLVGVPQHDGVRGTDAGAAYVFVRNGAAWTEQARLTASDAAALDGFGAAVALSGETALVGQSPDPLDGSGVPGAAYVFVRSGTTWSEQQKLTASDTAPLDRFGAAVALLADRAVVGAYGDDHAAGNDAGSAYVFDRTGAAWTETGKLTAPDADASDLFGRATRLSGNTLVVGAPQGDDPHGAVYVSRLSDGAWTELGAGLAGAGGVPSLVGDGTLVPGSPGTLSLGGAAPSAAALLFVGFASTPTPFKGGVLVPVPAALALPLVTSGAGDLPLAWASWPSGLPAGSAFFLQYAVADPGAPAGAALSNALAATAP